MSAFPKGRDAFDEPTKLRLVQAFNEARAISDEREGASAQEEEKTSYAEAFLLEFRVRRGDVNQPVRFELEGGQVFECGTKILCDEDVSLMGILMASRGYTLFPILDLKAQRLFFAALMFVGTTRHDDENEPRFDSLSQAEEWIQEPGLAEAVNFLRGVLLMRNPFVKKNFLSPEPDAKAA